MHMENERGSLIVQGSSFQIAFRRDGDRIRACVTGALGTPAKHLECWRLIARETVLAGVSMLLVVDNSTGDAVTLPELEQFIHDLAGLGLENVRTSYVGGNPDRAAQDEIAEIFAREQGFVARVFGMESEALLWLRHGER